MYRFILRRLGAFCVTLVVVSFVVFVMGRAAGDPRSTLLGDDATLDTYHEAAKRLGLDKPLLQQYGIFVLRAFQGDLGISIRHQRPVTAVIVERLPATLQLGLAAFVFALAIGFPIGVLSAVARGTVWDYVGRGFALVGQGVPVFWMGIMAIFLFAVYLGWLPTGRRGSALHFVLPAVTLGWFGAAGGLRLMRSSLLEVLDSEYVRFAQAKGVPRWIVIWKHAMRNALIAPLTFTGLLLAGLVTGSVVVETVFAWPGLGLMAITSVYNSDYPLLQGVVLMFVVIYLLAALAIDVLYAYVDPRIRYR